MEKKLLIVLLGLIIILSFTVCIMKPKMHKPFSIDVIEYMIKFKTNGEIQTIKTTTTTTINNKED